jgi:CO/xanthine dehydrogenase FAD-binding subunit
VGDFATVGVAAQVTVDAAGVCRRAGIGLTNVGPIPIKATRAEESLVAKNLDDNQINQAANLALLSEKGVPSETLSRIKAPAGLDIGSDCKQTFDKNPGEI